MKKYTITLQDIRENENLNQAGAMPGDEIINNELSRVFSSTDDAFNKELIKMMLTSSLFMVMMKEIVI